MFLYSERLTSLFQDLEATTEAANLIDAAYAKATGGTYEPFGVEDEVKVKSNGIVLYAADAAARQIVFETFGADGLNDRRYADALQGIASRRFGGTTQAKVCLAANLAWRSASLARSLDRIAHKDNISFDALSPEALEKDEVVIAAAAAFLLDYLGVKTAVAA